MNHKEICRVCFKRGRPFHPLPESIPPKFEQQECSSVTLIMGKIFRKILTRHGATFDQICVKCLNEIERTYVFIKRCELSNTIIKKHLRQITNSNVSMPLNFKINEIEDNRNSKVKQQGSTITEVIDNSVDTISEDDPLIADRKIAEIDKLDNMKGQIDHFSDNEVFVKQEIFTDDEMPLKTYSSFFNNEKFTKDNDKPIHSFLHCIDSLTEPSIEQDIKNEPDLDIHTDEEDNVSDKFMSTELYGLCNTELNSDPEQHFSKHLSEKPVILKPLIKRSICPKKFENKSKYDEHYLKHETSPKLQCSKCSETFRYKLGLMNHLRTKHKKLLFQCPICVASSACPKQFETSCARNDHITKEHARQLIKCNYYCNMCGAFFTKKSSLETHKKLHKQKKMLKWVEL